MPRTIVEIEDRLDDAYVGITFHVMLLDNQPSVFEFTVDTATDVITATGHDYIDDMPVTVSVSSGGALPSPLVAATTYYARNVATDTLELSLTIGGDAIDFTTAGTGTLSISDVPLSVNTRTVAEMARKEIDYGALTNRPAITIDNPIITTTTQVSLTESVALNNSAGIADLPLISALCLVRGGTATPLNTTGKPAIFNNLASSVIILAGEINTVNVPIIAPIGT